MRFSSFLSMICWRPSDRTSGQLGFLRASEWIFISKKSDSYHKSNYKLWHSGLMILQRKCTLDRRRSKKKRCRGSSDCPFDRRTTDDATTNGLRRRRSAKETDTRSFDSGVETGERPDSSFTPPILYADFHV